AVRGRAARSERVRCNRRQASRPALRAGRADPRRPCRGERRSLPRRGRRARSRRGTSRATARGRRPSGAPPPCASRPAAFRSRSDHTNVDTVRLDKWLWAARFFKTRALATDAASGGHVHLNGARVKPSKDVRTGDTLEIRIGTDTWTVAV